MAWNQFKKIYYLNLDRRTDRKDHMEALCRDYQMIAERVSAVDGKTVNQNDAVKEGGIVADMKEPPGVIGCLLSHYRLYRRLLEEKHQPTDWFIIMEDDTLWHPVLKERPQIFQVYWNSLPKEAQFVKFNHTIDPLLEYRSINTLVYQITTPQPKANGSSCYAVRYDFLPRLLSYFPARLAIDLVFLQFSSEIYYFAPIDDQLWNTTTPTNFYLEHRSYEQVKVMYRGLTSCLSHSPSDLYNYNKGHKIDQARKKMNSNDHHGAIIVLDSLPEYEIQDQPELLIEYLDILSVSLYYTDRSRGHEIALRLRELISGDGDEKFTRIRDNLKFYGIDVV